VHVSIHLQPRSIWIHPRKVRTILPSPLCWTAASLTKLPLPRLKLFRHFDKHSRWANQNDNNWE
jgi:hypothetical protein